MSDVVVGVSIQSDSSGADQSVKSFKQQLRDASETLVEMNEKFGATSTQAVEAAKKVAKLKDAIGDAKLLADTFNPDKKFVAFGQAVNGVTSGFSALQGALGLFGTQSKEVEATLLKVQSAMALQQGISGIFASIDAFKLMAGAIRTQVVAAFTTLRGAIIATGIGALAVAVGLVIANFDKLKAAISGTWIGKFVSGIGDVIQKMTDFVGITSEAARAMDDLKEATDATNKALDGQIKILEAQGGKEKEIYALKKQRIENERNLLIQNGVLLDSSSMEDRQRLADLNTDLTVLDAEYNRKKIEEAKKTSDKVVKIKQEETKALRDIGGVVTLADMQADIDAKQALKDKEAQDELDRQRKSLQGKNVIQVSETSFIKQQTAARITLAQKEHDTKVAILGATANALTTLSDLAGRQTVAGKVLAIASATINTYLGASKAIAQGGVFGVVSAIGVIAAGLAQVKNIVAVKVPYSGGQGSSPQINTEIPNINPSAPVQATAQTGFTQLDPGALNQIGNATVRAFVVESDVSNSQERITRLNRAARL
jgi:hypothetical protein